MNFKFFILIISGAISALSQNTLLWQISDSTGKQSYILGTMHTSVPKYYNFKDTINDIISYCDVFVGEIAEADLQFIKQDRAKLFLPDSLSYEDFLSNKELKYLKKVLKKELGSSLLVDSRIKPVYLSPMLTQKKLSTNLAETIDIKLQHIAKDSGLSVVGLETVTEQMNALESEPLEQQFKQLIYSLKTAKESNKELNKLLNAYYEHDLTLIQNIVESTSSLSDTLTDNLIYKRNEIMVNRLIQIMKKNSVFCAVGAAHLPGKLGMLEILSNKGYKLTPIFIKKY